MAIRNKTIIIGCGRLGSAAALSAYRKGGNVIVIDDNADAFLRLADDFGGVTINADSTDLPALEKAGVKDAKVVLITTGDDNVNLFLAHVIDKVYEVPHIYVRFDDPDKKLLIDGYNVKAIYPFELSFASLSEIRKEDE